MLKGPAPLTLEKGDTAFFVCAADANPQPEIKWIINGEEVDGKGFFIMLRLNHEGTCMYIITSYNYIQSRFPSHSPDTVYRPIFMRFGE